MEFKIEGTLNLADKQQVKAAIAFLNVLHLEPGTEIEVKKLNVVAAEVVSATEVKPFTAAEKAAATKKANAAAKAATAKEEPKTEEEETEEETPAAEAAREEAPEETKAETTSADFSKDDCREVLGAISLAGHKNEIKALLNTQFGVSSITSLSDDQVDPCYAALKKMATELKVKLD